MRYVNRKYSFFPVLVLFSLPITNGYIEDKTFVPSPPNVVETAFVMQRARQDVWNHIRFYEQIKGDPPLLLKLGLPKPLGTEGYHKKNGDLTKCIYHNGHIVKKMTILSMVNCYLFVLSSNIFILNAI